MRGVLRLFEESNEVHAISGVNAEREMPMNNREDQLLFSAVQFKLSYFSVRPSVRLTVCLTSLTRMYLPPRRVSSRERMAFFMSSRDTYSTTPAAARRGKARQSNKKTCAERTQQKEQGTTSNKQARKRNQGTGKGDQSVTCSWTAIDAV